MFTCIACTKPVAEDGREEEGTARGSGTPNTKDAVKSLTSQIKDMALKFSGVKQCKPCTGSSSDRKGHRPYPDFDAASDGAPYPYFGGGSSSSTPAWDFTTSGHNRGRRADLSRFSGVFSGDQTPGRAESISAQSCDAVLEDEDEPKEWMAQVEPGVHITFVSRPNGGNDLKRIRFRHLDFEAGRCLTSGKHSGGGVRIMTESWSSIMFRDLIGKLFTPPLGLRTSKEILLIHGWSLQEKAP